MYNYTAEKGPKNTVEATVTIPKDVVKREYELAFEILKAALQIEGFRKGKVPEAIAQKHIAKETVYQELLRTIVPKIYDEIVKKENLKPIISPKIELVSAKENEDWRLRINIAQKPVIDLSSYKDAIKKVKASAKKADIWVPGKSQSKEGPTDKEKTQHQQELLNQILSTILMTSKIEIPDIIVEEELNRRLAKLVDDIQKIGLTTEAYLKSKGLTIDEQKARFKREIEDTYKLEFLLQEIADKEGIKIENSDLDKLFLSIKDEKEREMARKNSYFYASVLRKQKTLDYLLAL